MINVNESYIGFPWWSIWRPADQKSGVVTTELIRMFWCRSDLESRHRTWITYIYDVLSIKTILFDILDFWCQLEEIQFVKTLSKRRMFVSFMKISACRLLHRLIKFNKICWEKRPAHCPPTAKHADIVLQRWIEEYLTVTVRRRHLTPP